MTSNHVYHCVSFKSWPTFIHFLFHLLANRHYPPTFASCKHRLPFLFSVLPLILLSFLSFFSYNMFSHNRQYVPDASPLVFALARSLRSHHSITRLSFSLHRPTSSSCSSSPRYHSRSFLSTPCWTHSRNFDTYSPIKSFIVFPTL